MCLSREMESLIVCPSECLKCFCLLDNTTCRIFITHKYLRLLNKERGWGGYTSLHIALEFLIGILMVNGSSTGWHCGNDQYLFGISLVRLCWLRFFVVLLSPYGQVQLATYIIPRHFILTFFPTQYSRSSYHSTLRSLKYWTYPSSVFAIQAYVASALTFISPHFADILHIWAENLLVFEEGLCFMELCVSCECHNFSEKH